MLNGLLVPVFWKKFPFRASRDSFLAESHQMDSNTKRELDTKKSAILMDSHLICLSQTAEA